MMNNSVRNKKLGSKWFVFYSRVRPFLTWFFFIPIVADYSEYTDLYIDNFWLMLYFIGAVTQVVLSIIVFVKSFANYDEFVRFIYGVLLFETINMAYQQAVQQYIQTSSGFLFAFVMFVIALIVAYFIWYIPNVKYFEKRIFNPKKDCPIKPQNSEPYKSRFTECPKCGYIAVFEKKCPKCDFVLPLEVKEDTVSETLKILFCRKCGAKLLEGARFCKECGTEIITKVEGISDVL